MSLFIDSGIGLVLSIQFVKWRSGQIFSGSKIRKSDTTVHNLGKFKGLHLAEPGLMAGRLAGWPTKFGEA